MAGLENYDGDRVEEEKNKKRYLEKDNFGDWCMGCQYLFKKLEEKKEICSDCIFNTLTNTKGNDKI